MPHAVGDNVAVNLGKKFRYSIVGAKIVGFKDKYIQIRLKDVLVNCIGDEMQDVLRINPIILIERSQLLDYVK